MGAQAPLSALATRMALLRRVEQTLVRSVALRGVGVHSGKSGTVRLDPAAAGEGIVFASHAAAGALLPLSRSALVSSRLATALEGNGVRIVQVEHLLAALRALGVDNARVTLEEGEEVPVLDGGAAAIMDAIGGRPGVVHVPCGRQKTYLAVRRTIRVDAEDGLGYAELAPSDVPSFHVTVDFPAPVGVQEAAWTDCDADGVEQFRSRVAPARTFAFEAHVRAGQYRGMGLGASEANTMLFSDDGKLVNEGGFRVTDEPACHKLLDAVGDLSLAGPIGLLGAYRAYRPGHALNAQLVSAVLEADDAVAKV